MFKDRIDAGKQLAEKLKIYSKKRNVVILGIPRGGVMVASVVSKVLHLPLDIIVIKKIGFPGNEEFAIGATGPDIFHIDEDKISKLGVDRKYINIAIKSKQKEARERYDFLSKDRTPESLKDKDVILIDDGIATGETMALAVQIVKKKSAKKVIVAVPVASEDSLEKLNADEVICLLKPKTLGAIGEFYIDFLPVEDSEVKRILGNG
ncbi:MAG: phosphoribosyltransferase family protein [archaeon]